MANFDNVDGIENALFIVNTKSKQIEWYNEVITDKFLHTSQLEVSLKYKEFLIAEEPFIIVTLTEIPIEKGFKQINDLKNYLETLIEYLEIKHDVLKEIDGSGSTSTLVIIEAIEKIRTFKLLLHHLGHDDGQLTIPLPDYVENLIENLKNVYHAPAQFTLKMPDELEVDSNAALTIGNMLNELIINSFKHAFQSEQVKKIKIDIKTDGNGTLKNMTYTDNGSADKPMSSPGYGMTLLNSYAKNINGNFIHKLTKSGYSASVDFET